MKIVKGIFITSFITLFIFLTIDHFFGRIILDYLNNKSDGISSFSSKDKNLGLTFEKSQKIRNAQWGNYYYTFCSNELSLRSKCEKNDTKKKYEYAFIGDSFTEGIGLDYEKTFVGLFDKKFGNTINFGISGASPTIHFKRLDYFLNKKEIDVKNLFLFFDLTDFEDEYGWATQQEEYIDYYEIDFSKEKYKVLIKKNFVITYHILLNIWWEHFRKYLFKYDKHLRLEDKRYAWDYLRTDSIDNFKYKKDLVLKNLKKISNLTNLKNIKLFIVIYPHPGTILFLENIEISKNNELISNFCNDTNNCNFISLYDSFFKEQNKMSKKDIINRYYFKGDLHFNEEGNKFIYQNFIKKLDIN
jgi:lysophospholipase L1-like esterase